MKLNGWLRIAVVFTATWTALVCGFAAYEWITSGPWDYFEKSEGGVFVYWIKDLSYSKTPVEGFDDLHKAFLQQKFWTLLLLPILIVWSAAGGLVPAIGWIRSGFSQQRGPQPEGPAQTDGAVVPQVNGPAVDTTKTLGNASQKFKMAFIDNGRLKLLVIKTLQVGGILLIGGVALTLLKYAKVGGGLPAFIVALPLMYAVVHVLKPLNKAWGCAVVAAAFTVTLGILLAFISLAEEFNW